MDESTSVELIDVERQRALAEREVMLELQRATLPVGLPVLPDLSVAAEYRPADLPRSAGGDWFDVLSLPDGTLALIVGDVVGSGPLAAAVMGQLRAITAERLQRGNGLDEVLHALDAFATGLSGARGSTVCIAIVDRAVRSVQYAVRGHPAPLVAAADGATRYLRDSAGPPLALRGTDHRLATATLSPGDTLILYSDGAVEQPGRTMAQGMTDLSGRVSEAIRSQEPDERALAALVCSAVSDLAASELRHDDVSVVAVTAMSAPPTVMTMSVPATADRLGPVRRQLSAWLSGLGATEDDLLALELSVIEAVTNSVEHAFPGPPGTVRVNATLSHDGTVVVVVSDDGRWKPPQRDPGFRGRGLIMMREFSDEIRLDPSASGTTVTLAKTLHRPVSLDGAAPPSTRYIEQTDLQIDLQAGKEGVTMSVSGAVDSSSVDQLHASLLDAGRGSLPLTIVLDAVTLLTSAGLRTLYEHASHLLTSGRRICLVAEEGTPARDVLAVSGLDRIVDVVGR
ncbi:MAG TPA: SpoIIE family protein phosphatase [Actinophytocola sp.]|uniref:SpoIIE family protein phosphatase n=1 Tax=Actinophytocola sp. TaxID=1872138 RepID=UPI002DDD58A9|nr:SpoIIE family protein phosphatase [Actinophytocola sp.]HEV2781186.1 SpoIIE family protein phosphatase [Actinophytocola sp.]